MEPPNSQPPTFSSSFNAESSPPDLTRYITKIDDQYLAGGGFGDVYRCQYIRRGSKKQEVAVKALRFKYTLDGDKEDKSAKMLRRELGIWKRLSHKNIVPFLGIAYGFGMGGTMSLVSLWMPNETLHKFLATYDDKVDVVHRLQMLYDISEGLQYLHSFPIVHGDLNSNNVLLDADYTARLADFGYASLAGNIPEALTYLRRSTARPGALRWIAPEQIDLEGTYERTTKSDIYSFGCIALQVLSGKPPWSEVHEDASIVLRLHLGHKPGRPEYRTMKDSHWEFIQRCWLPLQDRPTIDTMPHSIQRLLSDYPKSTPLRDLFIPPSSPTQDFRVDSSSRPLTNRFSVPIIFRFLADLWNKIKQDSSAPTEDISENDIVIFVVGPTGSGKSWFIREATRSDVVRVSKHQYPHPHPITSRLQAIRCELTEEARRDPALEGIKSIVFVDTPSFLTGYESPDARDEFGRWFDRRALYNPRYVGVIYMHRIETDPALEPIADHLQELSKVLQKTHRAPLELLVVRSYDGESQAIVGSRAMQRTADLHKRVEALRHSKGMWNLSMHKEYFQGKPEEAWRAVEELLKI